jgi:hypothetical protein
MPGLWSEKVWKKVERRKLMVTERWCKMIVTGSWMLGSRRALVDV